MRCSTQALTILVSFALCASARSLQKRAVAFFNPVDGGGSMLDDTGNGLGEPLNVSL